VILRDDGNFAIQPNNRVLMFEPSMTTKTDNGLLIERLVNTRKWDVEDADKWTVEDSNKFYYSGEEKEAKSNKRDSK
jgi:hypothetical protein